MISDNKKQYAADLLRQKAAELGRIPKKDDFDELTRTHIKAFLGPWPRALEFSGLKEAPAAPSVSRKRKRPAQKGAGE